MKDILFFNGEFRFLSNFYPAEVTYDNFTYPTVEHAYQAAKTTDEGERKEIRLAKTPSIAKELGQMVSLRPEWEDIKLHVMLDLNAQKFSIPELKQKLINTENAFLQEGNTWNDTFWGVCRREGKNYLGRILMKVRDVL